MFEGILENGKKLLDSIESPTEKDALQAKLDELTKLWDDTGDKFNKENAKEGDVLEKTKKLDDKMSDLEKFLDDQEKKLRDLEPVACSPEKLDQQQKEINVSLFVCLFFCSASASAFLVLPMLLRRLIFVHVV